MMKNSSSSTGKMLKGMNHLQQMHEMMRQESPELDDTPAQLLEMADSAIAYVVETQTESARYRDDTKTLLAPIKEQGDAILSDLQQAVALQDELATEAQALAQAQQAISQHTNWRQQTYNRLNPALMTQPAGEENPTLLPKGL